MKKINLGSGNLKKEEYINVDISPKCEPDVVADITKLPWDWANQSIIERIEMDNLAEHIEANTFIKVVNEAHRNLIPGGTLWIKVPELREGNLMPCFTDPTHINYFTEQTFGYFINSPRWRNFGKDYGILMWSDLKQVRNGIFLEITLTK